MGYRPQPGAAWVQQILDGQPVGYLAKFEASTKLAFLTVHGAGHEVPTYKPAVALNMFASYLKGTYTGN
jgi:cathepsin A (carboxypeptidase C)/serine carboxypeptidase-like clade 2